jgi:hypothetical protein
VANNIDYHRLWQITLTRYMLLGIMLLTPRNTTKFDPLVLLHSEFMKKEFDRTYRSTKNEFDNVG